MHVVLLQEKEAGEQSDMIDRLLRQPLRVKDFQPLTREEAHARK